MNTNIQESMATGEEIGAIVNQLEGSLLGVPRGHGIIALLSLVLILMDPNITPEDLQNGVRDTSRYICLLLEKPEEGQKVLMN